MKTSLTKLFAALIIGATCVCGQAATPTTFNVVNINRVDGETERLLIDAKLDISLSDEGTLLLVHPEITVEYQIEEVETITFDRDDSFSGLYEGDHQSGINAPEIAEGETIISVSHEEIRVSGGKDIELYDLKGVKVATRKAEGGITVLPTTTLPEGIYIVKAGNSTLKIKL